MNFKGENRFDRTQVLDMSANPVSSIFAGVIEGRCQRNCVALSDLSPSSTLSGGVEADSNSRNCFGNASNPLVATGHAQRMTNTSLKTAINIAGAAPRPFKFFNVPVLDEVFAESRLGNPDERVSVEKRGRAIATGSLSCSQTVAALKNFCQSVAKTQMKVGEPWATIGRAANHAGQHDNIASLPFSRLSWRCRGLARSGEQRTGRQGATISGRFACNLNNPHVEKEARLRSQHYSFGSGETCMQMRSWQRFGGIDASTPPRSHNFMKYLTIILTIVPSLVLAQGDNYSVSYTDPSTGDIRFLNATVTQNLTKDQELALCHEKIMALFDSQRQRRFQQEQLRLLRQIANQ